MCQFIYAVHTAEKNLTKRARFRWTSNVNGHRAHIELQMFGKNRSPISDRIQCLRRAEIDR